MLTTSRLFGLQTFLRTVLYGEHLPGFQLPSLLKFLSVEEAVSEKNRMFYPKAQISRRLLLN